EPVEGSAVGSFELPHKADVVVVGAGYTGLSAARRLAFAGASVVVLERERAGWGASSRNGGQVLTGLKLDAAALVARYGEARARELFDVATSAMADLDALIASESIACEYTRCGHLQAAWKRSHYEAFVDEQALLARLFNHPVRLVPRRFVPVGSYIVATAPLDPNRADALLPHRRVVFDSKNFLYYFRLTADRRLLFGGRAEFGTPDPETTCRAAAILHEGMLAVFPQLAGVGIEYAWGGNVAFTRDQMPRAGRLDGLYYAGGYAGHGIAMATHLGGEIARRIAGEPITHPLFDDDFPAIPAYSGTPWFLPPGRAYYQVKDWLQ